MSINRYKPHLIVLPEDDANRQIANGFIRNLNINANAIQIVPIAGGWEKVVDQFMNDYVPRMRQFSTRMIVLLMDFDQHTDRLNVVKNHIPDDLKDRVFVLGVLSEPEDLKKKIHKTFEEIGDALAKDCPDKKNELWEHELLRHNESELDRIIPLVQSFLFRA